MKRIHHNEKRESNKLIFGIRAIMEAIHAGQEMESIFIRKGLSGTLYNEFKQLLGDRGLFFQMVPVEKLDRLGDRNHQGVAAFVSPIVYEKIEDILPLIYEKGETPFLLLLDRVTDVRNFGAIARTAECAGIHAIIIPSRGAAQINPDAVKTSAGALYKIPVCREANLKDTIYYLQQSGVRLVAATEKTKNAYTAVDLTGPLAIVLGSEEDGISDSYLKMCDDRAAIPILGEIESLNVSVAGGVMLYEAVRQRQQSA